MGTEPCEMTGSGLTSCNRTITAKRSGNNFLNNGEANWDNDYTEMINECLLIITSAFHSASSYWRRPTIACLG